MLDLTIITICLNEAQSIDKTLLSIKNQTWQNFELIIIDGGSTDRTLDEIQKYKSRIDILVSEKDSGIYNAMNKGILLSKGEYLLFLNGGDQLYANNVLEKVFTGNPKHKILFGNLAYSKNNKIENVYIPEAIVSRKSLFRRTLPHPATFIKRELFLKFGLYDESYKIAADYEFFLRVILKNKVNTLYLPFTISVFDVSGISSSNENLRVHEKERAMNEHFGLFDRIRYDRKYLSAWIHFFNYIRYPRYLAGYVKQKFIHHIL